MPQLQRFRQRLLFGHTGVVATLIIGGANPNARDRDGKSTLELATKKGHEDIVNILKAAGAE